MDLLEGTLTCATDSGLIPSCPTLAVDATGLDRRQASGYFAKKAPAESTHRTWPKLTVAVDTHSHTIAGATVSNGPSNDSPQFTPVLLLASLLIGWDRVLADTAFDSEGHHHFARQVLSIRSSVIPLNPRRHHRIPTAGYRGQMARRFVPKPKGSRHKRVFGQRWQVESAISRHKRRLGSKLSGRSQASRIRECYLRVLTHNLMLLAATV